MQTKLKISQLGTRLRALTLEVGELACLAGRSLGADLEEEIRVAESAVEVARSELRLREAELARTSADGVEKVKVGQRVQAARTKVAAAEQALLLTKQKAYEQLGQQVLAGGTPIDGCDSQIEEFARVRDELRALESASAELGSRVKNNKPALFLLGSVAILCLCLFTCFLSAVANGPRAGAGATCAELESQMRQFYRDSPSVPGYHWGIDERAWLGQFGSPDAARGAGLLEFAWWMYACSDGELWVQIQEKVRRERGALLVLKYEARHK